MTTSGSSSIRELSPLEAASVHVLSRAVGWPHREEDLRFFLELGHGLAVIGADGGLDACAAWWPFGRAATIGLVIVRPELQGRGIGRALMKHVLDAAGSRRLHLHATQAGKALYEKQGFVAVGLVRQHQGVAALAPCAAEGVRSARPEDRSQLLALDAAAVDADRTFILDRLASVGQVFVHEEAERLSGFAVLRPFGRGHVLGPVIAATSAGGIALLRAGIAAASGSILRVDTPLHDERVRRLLTSSGLVEVATALPMVKGGAANPSGPARVYALAAQALG